MKQSLVKILTRIQKVLCGHDSTMQHSTGVYLCYSPTCIYLPCSACVMFTAEVSNLNHCVQLRLFTSSGGGGEASRHLANITMYLQIASLEENAVFINTFRKDNKMKNQ